MHTANRLGTIITQWACVARSANPTLQYQPCAVHMVHILNKLAKEALT